MLGFLCFRSAALCFSSFASPHLCDTFSHRNVRSIHFLSLIASEANLDWQGESHWQVWVQSRPSQRCCQLAVWQHANICKCRGTGGTPAESDHPSPSMQFFQCNWGLLFLFWKVAWSLSAYAFVSRIWGEKKQHSMSWSATKLHVELKVPGIVKWLLSSPCESDVLSSGPQFQWLNSCWVAYVKEDLLFSWE